MDVLILRLIHIGFGAFWVGAVFTNAFFLQSTAAAIGPAAAPFQYHLVRRGRFADVILASAVVTILAGLWLLWRSTDGFRPDLLFDPSRLGFTVGGVAAILTFALGATYVYPRIRRVASVLDGPMAEGRAPSPEEGAALGRLARELRTAGWGTVAGLAVAVAAMATARLWSLVL
jgi:hypothetical protein